MMTEMKLQPGTRYMRQHLIAIAVLFMLMIPAGIFAAGFGQPSNPAGIWEMTVTEGTHLISFPVLPEDATLMSVLGQQFPGGFVWEDATRVVGVHADTIAGSYFSNLTGEWVGDLVELHANKAYWLIMPDGEPDVNVRLIGAALSMAETIIDTLSPGLNYVVCPAIVPVTMAGSGLIESGCVPAAFVARADRVYTWSSDLLMPAWKHPVQGWIGAEFTFHPGKGYIVERATGDFDIEWTRPELIVGAEPPRGGEEPVVTPAIAPMLQSLKLDFSSPPWESRTHSSGGKR